MNGSIVPVYAADMVHNSKAKIEALVTFVKEATSAPNNSFEVSDVKQDGSVFVRFRSSDTRSASDYADTMNVALTRAGRPFEQTTDVRLRVPLDGF